MPKEIDRAKIAFDERVLNCSRLRGNRYVSYSYRKSGGAIVETGVRGVEKRRKKAVAIEGECCFSR